MSGALEELARRCEEWGGRLESVSTRTAPMSAPFSASVGMDWHRGVVYHTSSAKVGDVIHEMGHVFLDEVEPGTPGCGCESRWWGWEWKLAQEVGLTWEEWADSQKSYHWSHMDFGMYSSEYQRQIIRKRVIQSTRLGYIVDGRTISIRRPG